MADVFISYASEDRDRVRPLAEALQKRGFNIWWDRSLAAGQDYTAVIDRELRGAKAVIVVWTRSSAASTFVRDEAGRARDQGRLVPVLLDRVEIPLGFGAFQAEDFTSWNGAAGAAQMQILEETLRAKLAGREVDGGEIARRRKRLGARIRMVSLLTVIALVVGIAVGGKYLFAPPQVQQANLQAELLRLLADGKLTPEQAIQLAQILESGALGDEQQVAQNDDQSPAAMAPSAGASEESRGSASAPAAEPPGDGVQLASVSEAQFSAAARDTYRTTFLAVAQHPDAQVRVAAAQMATPATRADAAQTLWSYAQSHPDDPLRQQIYLLCGSVGEANGLALGQQALEAATGLSPRDPGVWRMLSRSYRRMNQPQQANATAEVSVGLEAQAQGQTGVAEERLQQALPQLQAPELKASVASELGHIAEQRQDWSAASARFAESFRAREEAAQAAPQSPAAAGIAENATDLVVALDRSGRTREACERLRQAQESHDVATPEGDLAERCQRQFRVPLRERAASPALRERAARPAPAAATP